MLRYILIRSLLALANASIIRILTLSIL
jgi:hypothetical protein